MPRTIGVIGLALALVVGVIVYAGHEKFKATQDLAARNARCAQEQSAPPAAFKRSADCIGWSRSYDQPLPASG